MALAVNDYVKTHVLPQHQTIVRAIRDLMRDGAPDAEETIAYGLLVWKGRKIFATLSPNKQGITFSFTHGAEFEDRYGLLRGRAKVGRHILTKDLQTIPANETALRDYIRQAVEVDAK